jgi:hypothetical protein
MVPSKSCIVLESADTSVYRRMVFSSALECCRTGVGGHVRVTSSALACRPGCARARCCFYLRGAWDRVRSLVARWALTFAWRLDPLRFFWIRPATPSSLPDLSCFGACVNLGLRTLRRSQRQIHRRSSSLIYRKAQYFPWDPTIRHRYPCLSICAHLWVMMHTLHPLPAKNYILLL